MPFTFKHGDRPLEEYTIQRAVGSGGFGEVYYAISDGGREVALKYLKSNPHVELRGVSHCINLKSPHLVSIFDVKKSSDGEYFVVMEYCSGPSLRELMIAEPNGFGSQKAAFFTREIGKGLSYLHDRGIVHRDLKPGNIFFDDGYVKIGDYGLSKFISISRHSAQTASVGTVHYMAPEISSGHYSRGVDLYALGVILYEMLLGRVPFEGSTMGEVLMKHLTAQPAIDELEPPFGKAIRRALEKDPNDRYQSVDELVEDLLSVENVRNSLAGFSVKSLAGAVGRDGSETPSPVPSPNPPLRAERWGETPRQGESPGGPPPLPPKVAKRMDRISRKLDRKVAKLARRHRGSGVDRSPGVPGSALVMDREAPGMQLGRIGLGRRVVLTGFMLVGLSVLLGVASGNWLRLEYGFASSLMSVGFSLGLLASDPLIRWFGGAEGPLWVGRMVRVCCCAPGLALGALPLLVGDQLTGSGLSCLTGLLIVAAFTDWEREDKLTVDGELSFGQAFGKGLGALIATAITASLLGGRHERVMFVTAGVAAIASIVTQASVWRGTMGGRGSPSVREGAGRRGARREFEDGIHDGAIGGSTPLTQTATIAMAVRSVDDGAAVAEGDMRNPVGAAPGSQTIERWAITRAFFGVLAFLLMGGAIVSALVPMILDTLDRDEVTGARIACIGCAAVMLFALRKTSPVRQPGFWRDTLRPMFITVGLFGVGASTIGMTRHWREFHDDSRVAIVIALVFSSLLLAGSLWIRGSRSRRPPPFLRGSAGPVVTPEVSVVGAGASAGHQKVAR